MLGLGCFQARVSTIRVGQSSFVTMQIDEDPTEPSRISQLTGVCVFILWLLR